MTEISVREISASEAAAVPFVAPMQSGGDLSLLFRPRSVAIVGASRSTTSISGRLIPVLKDSGFTGAIYPINPGADLIEGLPAFASLASLPERPDVAMVVVKAEEAVAAVEECVEMRVPYVVLHSSGFSETPERRELGERLRSILAGSSTRLLGPSSEGLIDTANAIALGFSPAIDPARRSRVLRKGNAVILSQSGALGFSLADFLSCNGFGVRSVVTVGNEMDLGIPDFMEHFAAQAGAGPIVLMLEHLSKVDSFIDAALKFKAKGIPVFGFRIGASAAGRRASLSHAGKVTGSAASYASVFAKAGVVELRGTDQFIDAMQLMTRLPGKARGFRVAVVSGSGGAGIWLADELMAAGLSVPELSDGLKDTLQAMTSPFAGVGNPIDLTAQAVYNGCLPKVLDVLAGSAEVDAIALVGGFAYSNWIIRDVGVSAVLTKRTKPVVAFSYNVPSQDAAAFFDATNVPCFTDPGRAARAFELIGRLSETARTGGTRWRRPPLPAALVRGLDDARLRRLLDENGARLNRRIVVRQAEDLGAAIASLTFPLVMKIDVPSSVHKTEIGGVVTGIRSERAAMDAADVLFERGRALGYDAVTVEPQLKGHEVFVAAVNDEHVGPMLVIGRGGTDVELNADVAHRLLPVSRDEVRDALQTLKVYTAWRDGFRGTPPANLDAIADFVVAFSDAVTALGARGWSEIECNPVIVDSRTATAVDLRLVVSE